MTNGRGVVIVTSIGMKTEIGKIANLLESAKEKKTPLQVSLDHFGKKLALGIIIICFIIFGLDLFRGRELVDSFMFAVSLAVAAIPEALKLHCDDCAGLWYTKNGEGKCDYSKASCC